MTSLDLSYPKSWAELDQAELRALLCAISDVQKLTEHSAFRDADDYSVQTWAMIAVRRIFAYNGLSVVCNYGDGYLVKRDKVEYFLTAGQVASVLEQFKWIREIPAEPVRLDAVGRFNALPADLSGLSFGKWLELENLWQGYNAIRDDGLLVSIGNILYPGSEHHSFSEAELLNVFYWVASVKSVLARRFSCFFKPSDSEDSPTPDFDTLQRSADAQIRALTKGDVTKEDMIYDTDVIRALTELDAQAREYEELSKKYAKK